MFNLELFKSIWNRPSSNQITHKVTRIQVFFSTNFLNINENVLSPRNFKKRTNSMNVLFMQNRERQGISSRIRAASNKVYHFACSSCTSHPPDEQRSLFAMTLRNFPVGNYCYLPRCSLFPRKFTRANFFPFYR